MLQPHFSIITFSPSIVLLPRKIIKCNVYNITVMGNIKMQVIVPEQLAQNFRKQVGQKIGARKGAISEGFIQALEDWIKKD